MESDLKRIFFKNLIKIFFKPINISRRTKLLIIILSKETGQKGEGGKEKGKGKGEGGGDVAINELRIHTVVLIITDVDLSLLVSVNHQYTGH